MVRLPAALVAAIDEFRREQPHIPSRPEAIRNLLKGQLVALGYIEAER
jgi:metal-responsive CopG/Arc/MetJ family transcriptional regulator